MHFPRPNGKLNFLQQIANQREVSQRRLSVFRRFGGRAKMKKIAKLLAIISAVAIINFFAPEAHAADLHVDEKIFAEQKSVVPPRLRRPFVPPINMGRREVKPAKVWPSRVPVRPTPRYLPSKPTPSRDNRGRFMPRAPRR